MFSRCGCSHTPAHASHSLGVSQLISESVAGMMYREQMGLQGLDTHRESSSAPRDDNERAERLIFFESLFFELDEDCSLFIEAGECESLLSYTALELDPYDRATMLKSFDRNDDGKLNRVEFVGLCMEHLWGLPIPTVERAMRNRKSARKARKRHNNAYWRNAADRLDSISSVVVPCTYVLCLLFLFHLDLRDEYATDQTAEMFQGLGIASLSTRGIITIAGYCAAVLCVLVAWVLMKSLSARETKRQQKRVLETGRAAFTHAAEKVSSRLAESSTSPGANWSTRNDRRSFVHRGQASAAGGEAGARGSGDRFGGNRHGSEMAERSTSAMGRAAASRYGGQGLPAPTALPSPGNSASLTAARTSPSRTSPSQTSTSKSAALPEQARNLSRAQKFPATSQKTAMRV